MATVHSVIGGLTSYFSILLLLQNVHCINITIVGPRQYARLDQSLLMTCTVPESELQLGSIHFKRNNTHTICSRGVSDCHLYLDTSGYTCSCGANGVFNLNIVNVSLQDVGVWICELQSINRSLYLHVHYGPFNNVTVDKTSPMNVIEDVAVSLTARCSADCNPACSYIWMKATQQVSESRYLPVGSFRRGQEGEYRCTARNTATGETADSQTLIVNVQWHPAQPTHNCPSWIVLGQTGSCTCQTSDRGNPAGTVQWIRSGGQTIAALGSSSVQLKLTTIPRSDNGRNYICRANNYLPNSNHDIAYIANIAYLERLQLKFDKEETHGNTSITVTCTAESYPIASMKIENIGSEAQPTSGFTNILTVTAKSHCLYNKFQCTAKNNQSKSMISTMERLNVVCSPRHDTSKQTDGVVTGQLKTTASLVADIIANPLPTFTWYHYRNMIPVPVVIGTDNVVATKGLQSVLKVHIKRDEDFGAYWVVVQNRVGITSLFFSLTKGVLAPETPSWNILPVAAGEGVVIVMLIVAIVVIVYRRSLFKGGAKKGLLGRYVGDASGETITGQQRDDSCQRGRDVDGPMPADSSVETEADKQTYTELREFETIRDSSTQGCTAYESLQVRTPQVYEDMKQATHVHGAETN